MLKKATDNPVRICGYKCVPTNRPVKEFFTLILTFFAVFFAYFAPDKFSQLSLPLLVILYYGYYVTFRMPYQERQRLFYQVSEKDPIKLVEQENAKKLATFRPKCCRPPTLLNPSYYDDLPEECYELKNELTGRIALYKGDTVIKELDFNTKVVLSVDHKMAAALTSHDLNFELTINQ